MKTPTIDSGRMRHRMALEKLNETPDGSGGFVTDWQVVRDVWAAIKPVADFQRAETGTLNAVISHKITLRWCADCLPQMRFLKDQRQFLINTVTDPDETKRYLVCYCEEKT